MAVYSHSRLSAYETCPLKYKFQYIDKPDIEKRDGVEAFLGSRCHESLEKLYKMLLNGKMWTLEELLGDFKDRWEKAWHDDIVIVRKELSREDYFRQGHKALTEYYRRYHPFDSEKTIALEYQVMFDLDDVGQYRLVGYIDRLSETEDGHYQIHDYKTERTWKTQEHFDKERQLALYQIGLGKIFSNVKSVDLIWHYLIFDKEARSHRTTEQLEELKANTITLIRDVEKAASQDKFPAQESALCDWCDFYEICPAKKHLHITEQLSPAEFALEDGVRLANRLVEIKNVTKELNAEKQQVEQMLFDYCLQLSVSVVRGSDHIVKVRRDAAFKPRFSISKDPDEKEAFLEFLKEKGLYDKIMSYNYMSLNSLIKSDTLNEALKAALMEHVVVEEGKPVFTISKLRKTEY